MTNNVFLRLSLTTALLLSPVAASAQTASATMASVANNTSATATVSDGGSRASPAAPEEKKICKQLPSSTSRMTKRSCLTEKEWKQVEQESQD
jgi:hypothetical protein